MRLSSIRLAGFKSFVDPTTVHFPTNMSAVVGPNGCGKSNIIDAVRWVMGESSAKNLRGESMTDVIFNGSNTRKPVTQASIELIFDNSDGTLVGEYAAFAEISIRRRVARDGQSAYFLNGTKCRRRDITDIFLGTGLGPRSYSIIEQGMISRLIEARPEDLRIFIEEAAGISKYKERRRDTELRIVRTQENLARLTDLRQELERQLERLQRQAQAAEKYQSYKAQERGLKAQLMVRRWQVLEQQVGQLHIGVIEQEAKVEGAVVKQRHADAHIEALRDAHQQRSEQFHQAQSGFYSVSGDISRVEQNIQHTQQRLQQLQTDWQQARLLEQEAQGHLTQDQILLADVSQQLAALYPEQQSQAKASEALQKTFVAAETQMRQWQSQWDAFAEQAALPSREAQVQQARIQQLEQSIVRLVERRKRMSEEASLLASAPEQQQLEQYAILLEAERAQLSQSEAREQAQKQALDALRAVLIEAEHAQQQLQTQLRGLEARLASLEALQKAALDPGKGPRLWLEQQGLSRCPRLAEQLVVAPGWERAVETVLGDDLQSVVLEDFSQGALEQFTEGTLRLMQSSGKVSVLKAENTLLAKVRSSVDLSQWLGEVYVADSLEQALVARASLAVGQSLITPDGYWVGVQHLYVRRASTQHSGVLVRAQELERTTKEHQACVAQLGQAQSALQARRAEQQMLEAEWDQQRLTLQKQRAEISALQAQQSAAQAKLEQLRLRRERLQQDIQEIDTQQILEADSCAQARIQLQKALEQMAQDTAARADWLSQRDQLRAQLEQSRDQTQQSQQEQRQLAVRITGLEAQKNAATQALRRLEQQLQRALERRSQLDLDLEQGAPPLAELQAKHAHLLTQRLAAEQNLQQARAGLEAAEQSVRAAEQARQQAEQAAQSLRATLEQQRMEWQAQHLRFTALVEQLQAESIDIAAVLEILSVAGTDEVLTAELAVLTERIERLGLINLAAIEEYQQQSTRKEYLDAQHTDLTEALATLEQVIRKIDRETRNRFKDTFDQINAGVQALFPKVFGGGHAYLELTGENLLDTGVAIMARPPGKKNSSIHMLSGGEKALTALALVFAIFKLNPAPFCMLDEVDAPLDDANVERYARLVKEMSQSVQFIYITHNKIAMEMADQLMGITMHEPGCSRLVSVDIAEAVALVDA